LGAVSRLSAAPESGVSSLKNDSGAKYGALGNRANCRENWMIADLPGVGPELERYPLLSEALRTLPVQHGHEEKRTNRRCIVQAGSAYLRLRRRYEE
jgi:hypothetical protein